MAKFIKQAEGFDGLPTGTMKTNWPWRVFDILVPAEVVDGAGTEGGKAFRLGKKSKSGASTRFQFDNTGSMGLTTNDGYSIFAFSGWVKVEETGVSTLPLCRLASETTNYNWIMGLETTEAEGTSLIFPTAFAVSLTAATAKYKHPITIGEWISFNIRIIASGTKTAKYSVSINDIDVIVDQNLPITNDQPVYNAVIFYSSTLTSFLYDDIVVQTVSGMDENWPAGFTGAKPNAANMTHIKKMPPLHIKKVSPTANGSVNEWLPSNESLQNYQAASTSGEYVEANEPDQVDLYKFTLDASYNPREIQAVVIRGGTSKHLNTTAVMKTNGEVKDIDNQTAKEQSFIGIIESPDGTTEWTKAKFNSSEFGQKSKQ